VLSQREELIKAARRRQIDGIVVWCLDCSDGSLKISNSTHSTIQRLKAHGLSVGEYLLEHLSPLGWEHINLTGDYVWRQNRRVESRKFRPLRPVLVS
jgi:Tn3 transposase DDE domain